MLKSVYFMFRFFFPKHELYDSINEVFFFFKYFFGGIHRTQNRADGARLRDRYYGNARCAVLPRARTQTELIEAFFVRSRRTKSLKRSERRRRRRRNRRWDSTTRTPRRSRAVRGGRRRPTPRPSTAYARGSTRSVRWTANRRTTGTGGCERPRSRAGSAAPTGRPRWPTSS